MGDNRDHSADSRFSLAEQGLGGPVPWENIGGRAEFITFSLDGTTLYTNPLTWFPAFREGRAGNSLRPDKGVGQWPTIRSPLARRKPRPGRPFRAARVREEARKAAVWLGMALAHRRRDRPRPADPADHRRDGVRGHPRRRNAPARPGRCRSRAAGGWRSSPSPASASSAGSSISPERRWPSRPERCGSWSREQWARLMAYLEPIGLMPEGGMAEHRQPAARRRRAADQRGQHRARRRLLDHR